MHSFFRIEKDEGFYVAEDGFLFAALNIEENCSTCYNNYAPPYVDRAERADVLDAGCILWQPEMLS